MPDLLENLWLHAINVDPAGKWMMRASQVPSGLEYYAKCAPALERLRQLGTVEDIGRVSRFIRFEACSELLYSLEDPGLPVGTSLDPTALIRAALSSEHSQNDELASFLESLGETLSVDDDGVWLSVMTMQGGMNDTFQEIANAVNRLLEAGASVPDLAQLAIWSSYEACESTLRLLHDLGRPDEVIGLFESLPAADPSGKEGGAGSWPI